MSAVAAAGERAYYITDFSDEVLPCEPTLAGWAEWLSRPDPEWSRDAAAQDGDTFEASVLRFEPDIIATHEADGWSFSREPAAGAFLAVRFGEGLGWDADNIVGDVASLREWLVDNAALMDEREFVAVGVDEPAVRLTYRVGPPPSLQAEVVQ